MRTYSRLDRSLPLLALPAALALGPAVLASPTPADDSLWVSDDVNVTIYNVALDGTLKSSFHSGSISGVSLSVDPVDGTIWAAKEGSNKIEHYTTAGVKLGEFSATVYDPLSSAPEGVAVDFRDGTLWIVDDDTHLVYNVQRDGTLITSFPTALFDPGALSPQDIAYDPLTDTLWLTDNGTDRLYNVTRQGMLVSTFPSSAFSAAAINLQGVGVDMVDASLWVTDRAADRIFNVTRNGVLLGWVESTAFGSNDPTGVTFQRGEAATLASVKADVDAGAASGKIGAKAMKHFDQAWKLIDKQLAKGNTRAVGSMLYDLKDFIVGKIGSGEIDESYGLRLAMSAVSASGGYDSP
jgi:DNA-binding beta-propeller fold protein YncE